MSALERLPDAALDADIAILGRKGGGKTYTAKGIVERLLDMGRRVLVLDPLGVWAGLRTASDGEHDGYPVAIFGGAHADLPLDVAAAPALANVIARENLPAVVDLSELTKTAQQSFLLAFLHELRRVNSEALTIVLEEADVFAPQNPQGDDSKQLHSEIDWIARRGRFRGFRLITITQRPARLSKDVLTQCSTLIAHKLPAPQDRDAVKAWVDGNGDRDRAKEVFDTLAGLSIGEAWVWAPEHEILQRMRFPKIKTLDTSSTPKAGERRIEPKTLAQVDLTGIRAALAEASQERNAAKSTDPKGKSKSDQVGATNAQLHAAHADGRKHGFDVGYLKGIAAGRRHITGLMSDLRNAFEMAIAEAERLCDKAFDEASEIENGPGDYPGAGQGPVVADQHAEAKTPATSSPKLPSTTGGASLTGAMESTLQALAWWSAIGVTAPTKKQLAAMLKIDPGGSTMRARLAELSKADLVEYPQPGTVRLTPAGKKCTPAPDRSQTLIATIRASLSEAELATFNALPKKPGEAISKQTLAGLLNIDANGSTLRARLAALSGRELIDYPKPGWVARQDWVVG